MQIQILINGLPVEGKAYQAGKDVIIHSPLHRPEIRRRSGPSTPIQKPVSTRLKRLYRGWRMGWKNISI
jgi:hypothetical protein